MVGRSRKCPQFRRQRGRIGKFVERAVQYVMSFLRDVGIAVGITAKGDLRSQSCDSIRDEVLREGDHFDLKWKFSKTGHLFCGIGYDDEPSRHPGDDLLP